SLMMSRTSLRLSSDIVSPLASFNLDSSPSKISRYFGTSVLEKTGLKRGGSSLLIDSKTKQKHSRVTVIISCYPGGERGAYEIRCLWPKCTYIQTTDSGKRSPLARLRFLGSCR